MTTQVKKRRGRKARQKTRAAPLSPKKRPIWPGMSGGRYQPLTSSDMQRIHSTALDLLEKTGMAQAIPSMISRVCAKGGWMDDNERLHYPRALVEDIIAGARRKFVLHGFDPRHDLEIGAQRVHTGTGGASPHMVDFETGLYRGSKLADLYDIARLVDRLDNIHWFTRSIVARDAVSPLDLDINTCYAAMMGTTKHIGSSFTNGNNVKVAVEMFDVALGGEGEFRKRPFCAMNCCHVVPPLRFAEESCEALEQGILAGMPALLLSAGQAGATSPAALAGSVVQAVAEVLAGLVFARLIDPDCRTLFATWPFVSDLRTGSMSGGSGEQAVLMAACAQMANFYDLPNSVAAGMTDSKIPDAQSGAEKGYTIALAAHAGANMIHESAGMHASLLGTAFESFVIDNDIIGAVLRTVRGIEVNDETLSFDVINDVVFGDGHYLGHPQTMRLMETGYLYPEVGDRMSHSDWTEAGARDVRDMARDKVRNILASNYPDHIAPDIDDKIRSQFNILLPRERMFAGNGAW